jgi:hypothetical protein
MRFDSVRIKNYRQYKNIFFDFKKSLDTDLHIIRASNGVGKTNLLNAVNWCLYGDEPHMSEEEDKLSICTESILKETSTYGETFCEVEVEIKGTDKKSQITITRTVKVNSNTGNIASKDSLIVEENFQDGNTEYYEKDLARSRIEDMFPIGIREYFFFDGEQLLNYFGEKTNTSAIKDSIYRIAQINSIQEAHSHLEEIIKKYNKEIGDSQPKLMEVLQKKDDAIAARNNRISEIEDLKQQINHAKSEISRLDKLIAGSKDAVESNQKRNDNREKIANLTEQKNKIADQLKSLIREYTVLLFLYDVNKQVCNYIQKEEDEGNLNPNIDPDIIMRCLKKRRCVVCDEELTEEVEARLLEIVNSVKISSATSKLFTRLRTELNRAMIQAKDYKEKKEQLTSTYSMIQTQIDELDEENEVLSEKIKMCSDLQGAATYMKEKENHEQTLLSNTAKRGKYEGSLESLDKHVKDLEEEYKKLEEECKVNEEIKQYRDFALEALDVVTAIENEMAYEVKIRMEKKTMSLFDELMWKKHTYARIELDKNFKFQLFNMDGKSCFGSCSAAEKELLALAFTISLHEVSGYSNLLFIDTPVGRVSDINRSNFANVLKEISKEKQIVLAFTPSEYSNEIKDVLDNTVVSSFNELMSDEIYTERK